MEGFTTHATISVTRSLLSSLAVTIALLIIVYVFAVRQSDYISDSVLFWAIVLGLVVSSFISTVMEAAFSTVTSSSNAFALAVTNEIVQHYQERSDFQASLPAVPSRAESKKLQAMHKTSRRLRAKHRLASGIDRSAIVGAFATLSVFLNSAIAIFLPLSMFASKSSLLVLPVPSQVATPACQYLGYLCQVTQLDLTNQKTFLIATSTIPILILGKIIPKAIGMNFPSPWLTKLSWLAPMVVVLFGWISLGCVWFFDRFRKPI
jgi:hypothetical protein